MCAYTMPRASGATSGAIRFAESSSTRTKLIAEEDLCRLMPADALEKAMASVVGTLPRAKRATVNDLKGAKDVVICVEIKSRAPHAVDATCFRNWVCAMA